MADTSVRTTLLYPSRENKDKREVTIKIYIQFTTELTLHTLQFLHSLFYRRKRQHPGSESCQNGFSNEAYLDLDELGPQVVMQSSNA